MRLYDTMVREKREFVPINAGQVTMYVCGATPQAGPHLGHMRSAVVFDTFRRWFEAQGLAVTFVRNITDIDDKIIAVANRDDTTWWRVVEENVAKFDNAFDRVAVEKPTVEPRATAHVPEIELLIRSLIDSNAAYVTESGSVYLAVDKLAGYGQLSGQKPAELQSGEPDEWSEEKRSPLDFALWKASKPGEPSWPMWIAAEGRPGWHIECTAMATKYLGNKFDIHGGGLDLMFPHHENELAQANAAGLDYANYWVHNGLIQVDGQKMGKSLGNSVTVDELFERVTPAALRYYLLSAHYRSPLNFSLDGLDAATVAYERIASAMEKAAGTPAATVLTSEFLASFTEAMEDDLNTPKAFASLNEIAKLVLSTDEQDIFAAFNLMIEVLGFKTEAVVNAVDAGREEAVVKLVELRAAFRAAGNYEASDEIRDVLSSLGALVQDGKA